MSLRHADVTVVSWVTPQHLPTLTHDPRDYKTMKLSQNRAELSRKVSKTIKKYKLTKVCKVLLIFEVRCIALRLFKLLLWSFWPTLVSDASLNSNCNDAVVKFSEFCCFQDRQAPSTSGKSEGFKTASCHSETTLSSIAMGRSRTREKEEWSLMATAQSRA